MAIQPIDLQALFTQLDKVGKNQTVQREGQQIQESIQQVQIQKKNEQNIQSINQSQDLGEEAGKIKDDKRGAHENKGGAKERQPEDEELSEAEEKRDLIRDPALGRNIDISG